MALTRARKTTASASGSSPSGLRLAGVDHLHTGTAVGKLEGDPMTVQGYYNVCRDSYTRQDLTRGLFSTKTGPICAR